MNNQKMENLLNLALDASDREREKSPELSAGFSRLDDKWTIIVRYAGSPDVLLTYSPVFLLRLTIYNPFTNSMIIRYS